MLLNGYGIGFSAPSFAQVIQKKKFLHIFLPFLGLAFQNLLLQLASEGILTPEELGWFPGSLVLGQVLGILVGPLLADLVIAFAIRMAMDFNKLQYLYYFPTW